MIIINRRPFNYAERLAIENMLNDNKSIKEIEYDIKRSSSGIIKEINKHCKITFASFYGRRFPCLKWNNCNVKSNDCYLTCKNIDYKICPKLIKSPHVCNGCNTKSGCKFVKKYYKARDAHDDYKLTLSDSRKGLHYNEKESMVLIERLCPLIINCKSVYHAVITINDVYKMNFNIKTIYWQISGNFLPIKSTDLPRCRKKKRMKKDNEYKRNIDGHSYEDYTEYKGIHNNAIETQMDTVEGIKGNNAPVILTLEIVEINFLFMFKIDSQSIDEVTNKLSYFKDIIGIKIFNKIMEILLTDNGKEC